MSATTVPDVEQAVTDAKANLCRSLVQLERSYLDGPPTGTLKDCHDNVLHWVDELEAAARAAGAAVA